MIKLIHQQIDATYLMHCANIARLIASIPVTPTLKLFMAELIGRLRIYAEITDAPIDFDYDSEMRK